VTGVSSGDLPRCAPLVAKGIAVVRQQYTWDVLTERFLSLVEVARGLNSSVNAAS
jgi:hypothetical protein